MMPTIFLFLAALLIATSLWGRFDVAAFCAQAKVCAMPTRSLPSGTRRRNMRVAVCASDW